MHVLRDNRVFCNIKTHIALESALRAIVAMGSCFGLRSHETLVKRVKIN